MSGLARAVDCACLASRLRLLLEGLTEFEGREVKVVLNHIVICVCACVFEQLCAVSNKTMGERTSSRSEVLVLAESRESERMDDSRRQHSND